LIVFAKRIAALALGLQASRQLEDREVKRPPTLSGLNSAEKIRRIVRRSRDNFAKVGIDQVVGRIGEERWSAVRRGPSVAGSTGVMNLGATSLAHETLHRRGQQAIPRRRALPIRLANSAEPCFRELPVSRVI